LDGEDYFGAGARKAATVTVKEMGSARYVRLPESQPPILRADKNRRGR